MSVARTVRIIDLAPIQLFVMPPFESPSAGFSLWDKRFPAGVQHHNLPLADQSAALGVLRCLHEEGVWLSSRHQPVDSGEAYFCKIFRNLQSHQAFFSGTARLIAPTTGCSVTNVLLVPSQQTVHWQRPKAFGALFYYLAMPEYLACHAGGTASLCYDAVQRVRDTLPQCFESLPPVYGMQHAYIIHNLVQVINRIDVELSRQLSSTKDLGRNKFEI